MASTAISSTKAKDGDAWGSCSAVYQKIGSSMTGVVASIMVDLLIALTADETRTRTLEVHDVACGPGVAANLLLARTTRTSMVVDASDFSPAMVEAAANNLAGRARRVFVADATQLPDDVKDASYDVVMSNFGIFVVPDVSAALREAARTLRPGGLCILTIWKDDAWGSPLFKGVCNATPDDNAAATAKVMANFAAMLDLEKLLGGFRDAGFERIAVRSTATSNVVSNAREFAKGLTRIPPLAEALKTVAEEGPTREQFLDKAAQCVLRAAGHEEPLVASRSAFVVSGYVPQ